LLNPIDVHVGQRIKLLRKLSKMSQAKLGDAVGMTFQQIQKYEHGTNRVGASRLFELSQILDVSISYFFDDMPPEIAGEPKAVAANIDAFDLPEAKEIARLYKSLPNQHVRNTFRNLAREFATPG
jgi:transcriptional regulator with XRE-family HTH domain